MVKTVVEGQRLQGMGALGAMGIVRDTIYRRCFWPKLDEPTALFAEGSSGIEVEGPPTPRNVVFPRDTKFLDGTRPDCHFIRHLDVVSKSGEKLRHEEYVAELDAQEVDDLVAKRRTRSAIARTKDFCHVMDNPLKADARVGRVQAGKFVPKKAS